MYWSVSFFDKSCILGHFVMQQVTPEQLSMVVKNCFIGDCSKQPNKSKTTEKLRVLSYSKRLALHSRLTASCPAAWVQPCFPSHSHAGLCHSVMIYLPRLLSCPGTSTRTCNGYVAGRGHVYTAQRCAASEIPIWLGGSQHTYMEQRSTLQKCKPESPATFNHIRELAQLSRIIES